MRVLVYTALDTEAGRTFVEVIEQAAPGHEIQVLTALAELESALHRPKADVEAAAFLISDSVELGRLYDIGELLSDIRMILVLPDLDPATMTLALALYPRYVTDPGRGFEDVEAVIKKMLAHASPHAGEVQSGLPASVANAGAPQSAMKFRQHGCA